MVQVKPDEKNQGKQEEKVNVPIRADSKEPVVIAVDASGVKVTNRDIG